MKIPQTKCTLWLLLLAGITSVYAQDKNLVTEQAVLSAPPMVPPPITRDHKAKVVVNLETRDK